MKKIFIVLAVLLQLAASSCFAVSLGRHQGATLIGRPLDLSVQAILDAQDDIASLCIEADVFYADTRLDKSRVRVTTERASASSPDAVIRIRTSSPVDEPVVTVYVRVGCQRKIERRYVTLADMASEMVQDRSPANLAAPSSKNALPVLPAPALAPAALAANVNRAGSNLEPRTRKVRSSRDGQNQAKSSESAQTSGVVAGGNPNGSPTTEKEKLVGSKQDRAKAAKTAARKMEPNRARLKLEPLDLSIERDPQLKPSATLMSTPSANPQERSAAAALWRAIAMQPQDIVRDFEKLQSLENSVRGLQAQTQKTQQLVGELDVKLQKASSDRYANFLVYALGFLLLIALAGLAYLLRKQSLSSFSDGGNSPWWRKREVQPSQHSGWVDSRAHGDDSDSDTKAGSKLKKSGIKAKAGIADPEIDLNFLRSDLMPLEQDLNFGVSSRAPLAPGLRSDFAMSMNHPARAVKAEELFDVQQQADFFVSIGQHDQAIDVLRNHIGDGAQTSAVIYLDLFSLYHQLNRKADYASLRDEFNSSFNAKMPVFDMYADAGPGLDAYPLAMSRIVALWPTTKVLELIEESIFRKPETQAESFHLQAYRELLMLHSVAKDIISSALKMPVKPASTGTDGRFGKFDKFVNSGLSTGDDDTRTMAFVSTSINPLSAGHGDDTGMLTGGFSDKLVSGFAPPASLSLGLDLDLSEPATAMEKSAYEFLGPVPDIELSAEPDSTVSDNPSQKEKNAQVAEKVRPDASALMDFDAFDNALAASDKFRITKR